MEYSRKVLVISLLFVQFNRMLCESQEVFFDVRDSANNEVIFVGEKNVSLLCHVTNTSEANITITKIAGDTVATNNGIGSCIEYNILNATQQNAGNYSCTARYEDNDTGAMVVMSRMLSVSVRNSGQAACLRNGTGEMQSYGEGDTLELICYCESSLECVWIRTVVGSQDGEIIQTNKEIILKGKVIRKITVGPLTSDDTATRYDCSYGSESDERCSIGPADVSINDEVLSSHPQSDQLEEGCPMFPVPIFHPVTDSATTDTALTVSTVTVSMSTVSMSTDVMSTRITDTKVMTTEKSEKNMAVKENQDDFLFYVIIGASGLLVLLLVILLPFVAFVSKRKGRKSQKQQDETETKLGHVEENVNEPQTFGDSSTAVYHDGQTNDVTLDDEDEEGDFRTVDVTEYNVPVAFRVDEFGGTFKNEERLSAVQDVIIAD